LINLGGSLPPFALPLGRSPFPGQSTFSPIQLPLSGFFPLLSVLLFLSSLIAESRGSLWGFSLGPGVDNTPLPLLVGDHSVGPLAPAPLSDFKTDLLLRHISSQFSATLPPLMREVAIPLLSTLVANPPSVFSDFFFFYSVVSTVKSPLLCRDHRNPPPFPLFSMSRYRTSPVQHAFRSFPHFLLRCVFLFSPDSAH